MCTQPTQNFTKDCTEHVLLVSTVSALIQTMLFNMLVTPWCFNDTTD